MQQTNLVLSGNESNIIETKLSPAELFDELNARLLEDAEARTSAIVKQYRGKQDELAEYISKYGQNVWIVEEIRIPMDFMDWKTYYENIGLDHVFYCDEQADWMIVYDPYLARYLPAFIDRLNEDRPDCKFDFPIFYAVEPAIIQ